MDYEAYIARLEQECDVVYQLAEQARSKGLDPRMTVEIPRASDLADRTQKLLDFLHPRQTAAQIREMTAIPSINSPTLTNQSTHTLVFLV
jgi:DNA polymerase II large subunit